MEWGYLLCQERLRDKNYQGRPTRSIFAQDHDRIVFSAPFRRLANKTQVQPLYEHDHVHHRLIHSIEVSSVGRSLAMDIGDWLVNEGHVKEGLEHTLAHIVQAACVAHDIGNPPFGHSGEEAMGHWFSEYFNDADGDLADISPGSQAELANFEGNAQGFRILSRLEMYRNDGGMRLSKATLGAFAKYPVTAEVREEVLGTQAAPYIGLKKFGIFRSEFSLFEEAAVSLGLPDEVSGCGKWWRRHPLVFVVEAADDISYGIVDLEDAFTTGELSYDVVKDILFELANKPNRDISGYSQVEHIAFLRALSIGVAIHSCVDAFKENYDEIMAGAFSNSLVGSSSVASTFDKIKKLSRDRIFTARRKTELEISGRRIIRNVMSGILPVFESLARSKWDVGALDHHSTQLVRALDIDLRGINCEGEALHAMADFTSGMTDRYALRISRMLSGT